jgi:hypothetical protein
MKNNLTLKILAVMVTIFIWVQTMLLKHQSTDVNLPVKLTNVPEQLALTHPLSQSVRFHVEGRGIDILLLKLAHTYVEIDARDLKFRNNIIPLNKFQVNLPKYITLTELTPISNDVIRFDTDELAKKTVPIVLQFSSKEVENKFRQMSLEQDIGFAEITGQHNVVDKVQEIVTKPISMDMLKGSAVKINLISPSKNVVLNKRFVELLPVKTEFATRTISMIPIQSSNQKVTVIPAWVSVKIQGAKSELEKVIISDIHASVQSNGIRDDQIVPVQVVISKPVNLIEYTPQKVRIQTND